MHVQKQESQTSSRSLQRSVIFDQRISDVFIANVQAKDSVVVNPMRTLIYAFKNSQSSTSATNVVTSVKTSVSQDVFLKCLYQDRFKMVKVPSTSQIADVLKAIATAFNLQNITISFKELGSSNSYVFD